MYNRYIPQPDGSYRRSSIPERQPPPKPRPQEPPEPPCPAEPPPVHPQPPKQEPQCSPPHAGVSGFLKQLLPKGFDTSDLLVVVLLLLMAGDCPEDQNHALLTLALYLFM